MITITLMRNTLLSIRNKKYQLCLRTSKRLCLYINQKRETIYVEHVINER